MSNALSGRTEDVQQLIDRSLAREFLMFDMIQGGVADRRVYEQMLPDDGRLYQQMLPDDTQKSAPASHFSSGVSHDPDNLFWTVTPQLTPRPLPVAPRVIAVSTPSSQRSRQSAASPAPRMQPPESMKSAGTHMYGSALSSASWVPDGFLSADDAAFDLKIARDQLAQCRHDTTRVAEFTQVVAERQHLLFDHLRDLHHDQQLVNMDVSEQLRLIRSQLSNGRAPSQPANRVTLPVGGLHMTAASGPPPPTSVAAGILPSLVDLQEMAVMQQLREAVMFPTTTTAYQAWIRDPEANGRRPEINVSLNSSASSHSSIVSQGRRIEYKGPTTMTPASQRGAASSAHSPAAGQVPPIDPQKWQDMMASHGAKDKASHGAKDNWAGARHGQFDRPVKVPSTPLQSMHAVQFSSRSSDAGAAAEMGASKARQAVEVTANALDALM